MRQVVLRMYFSLHDSQPRLIENIRTSPSQEILSPFRRTKIRMALLLCSETLADDLNPKLPPANPAI
jgi:hypothetical protein